MIGIIGVILVFCSLLADIEAASNPYRDLLVPHPTLNNVNLSELVIDWPSINVTELCENVSTINVTTLCERQLELICDNNSLQLIFFDASSKFPYPGLNYATKLDFGNFDQCLTINHREDDVKILGKFCANSLLIPTTIRGTIDEIYENAYKLSLCIPDQCSAEDVSTFFGIPTILPLVNDLACSTIETDTEITAGDIAVLTIFAIILNFMVLSTAFDYYLQRSGKKPRNLGLVAFSVFSNGRKLLQTSKGSKEQIMVFHGIKFISMLWILAGHSFAVISVAPFSNDQDAKDFTNKRYSQYVTAAYIAVDTFFYISGFLLAYQYLKSKPKPLAVQVFKVPNMYLHRYLRLTPALLMVFVFHLTLNTHMGSGPISSYGRETLRKPCTDNWWAFFLYVQNYHNPDQLCMTHTWYLSADMQMFVLAPLVLIPVSLFIRRKFRSTMIGLALLNLFLTILPIILTVSIRSYDNEYDTHSRLINYFMGIMFGAYLRETKEKRFAFSRKMNILIWIFIFGGMLSIFFCYKEVELNKGFVSEAIFSGLYRPAWCICLSWVVYSSYYDHGGPVKSLLAAPIFQIGSKLTYCMYLVHGHIIIIHFLFIRNRIHFSDYEVFYIFCGHLFWTWLVATIWTLAFESPLITIEKMIFGTPNPRNVPPPMIEKATDINIQEEVEERAQVIPYQSKEDILYLKGSGVYKITSNV